MTVHTLLTDSFESSVLVPKLMGFPFVQRRNHALGREHVSEEVRLRGMSWMS